MEDGIRKMEFGMTGRLLIAAVLALSFWMPRAVQAGPLCDAKPGTCLTTSECGILAQSQPGITSEPLDCTQGEVCCYTKAITPAASCKNAGGYCTNFCSGNEQDLGAMDCPGLTETCCKVPTTAPAAPAGQPGSKPGTTSGGPAAPGTLWGAIPASTRECMQTGDCSVDDIVQVGTAFARFLLGLSGALFFIIFIYGGAMYLLSFGDKSRVDKGKKAIRGAAIGIVIVMGAWTIVRYIVGGITGQNVTGPAPTGDDKCLSLGSQWSCQTFNGSTYAQASADAAEKGWECQANRCLGAANRICCRQK